MSRTTIKDLRFLLPAIRRATGTPEMGWTPRPEGGNSCPVGAYSIERGSGTYGYAWKLVQTCNDSGAEKVILSASTAGALNDQIHAWLAGMAHKGGYCDDRGRL